MATWAFRVKAKGAVRLPGATIGVNLDCHNGTFISPNDYALVAEGIKVGGSVFLVDGFNAEGEVALHAATIGVNLTCQNGTFKNTDAPTLCADGMQVGGCVFLRNGFKAEGEVKLHGATIGVNLECVKGTFINPDDSALSADGIKVGGDVFLSHGFEAKGEVRLLRASIGGNLDCEEGSFMHSDDPALSADAIKVEGSVFLRNGFKARGEVKLVGATIGGSLDCVNGSFINLDGDALSTDGMTVESSVLFRDHFSAKGQISLVGATIQGQLQLSNVARDSDFELILRSAHIGVLSDEPVNWPTKGKLHLHGLVYDNIAKDAPLDAKTRIKWLKLQEDEEYFPQPYEQLAAVLRKNGQIVDAREVLIAKEKFRRAKGTLAWFEKSWYYFFGPMIGYGYNPLRAFWLALMIIALGWLFFLDGQNLIVPTSGEPFSATYRDGTSPYPTFNALFYSLDTFIPIVDFHQVKYRLPNAEIAPEAQGIFWSGNGLLWWFWFEVGAGWVITSVLVYGVARFVRS